MNHESVNHLMILSIIQSAIYTAYQSNHIKMTNQVHTTAFLIRFILTVPVSITFPTQWDTIFRLALPF